MPSSDSISVGLGLASGTEKRLDRMLLSDKIGIAIGGTTFLV